MTRMNPLKRSVSVAIGLGSNLGYPPHLIRAAVGKLTSGGLEDPVLSSLYETSPVDCRPGTPAFVNAALTGQWRGGAEDLLALCHRIEVELGRPVEHCSQSARTIDLDLLLFGEERIDRGAMRVPHVRLGDRLFVLTPLREIAPDWRIPPGMGTVAEAHAALLAAAPPDQTVRLLGGRP